MTGIRPTPSACPLLLVPGLIPAIACPQVLAAPPITSDIAVAGPGLLIAIAAAETAIAIAIIINIYRNIKNIKSDSLDKMKN